MAVTRRGYIFGAFLSGVLCVLLIIVAVSSDSWIVSTARASVQVSDSSVRYGLFRGELTLRNLATANYNPLYMTCVPQVGACAVSCRTEREARVQEVIYLSERLKPSPICAAEVNVDDPNDLMERTAVIPLAIYASLVAVLFFHLLWAIIAAGLAILNATKNPTEPAFGLPGCLWTNVMAAVLGLTALLLFGIYYSTSGLKEHLALSYIAVGQFVADPGLGYSYWLLILAVVCSLFNIFLIELRRYLLERDPPPPTIKVENQSDGTIFLY